MRPEPSAIAPRQASERVQKARGVKLGRQGKVLARVNAAKAKVQARTLRPAIVAIRKAGKTSVREIMDELNARGIRDLAWRPLAANDSEPSPGAD